MLELRRKIPTANNFFQNDRESEIFSSTTNFEASILSYLVLIPLPLDIIWINHHHHHHPS